MYLALERFFEGLLDLYVALLPARPEKPACEHRGERERDDARDEDRHADDKKSLYTVLRHRKATMMVTAATLIVTIYLFYVVPKGFLPSEDTGQIFAFTEAQQGISFEDMAKHQQELAAIIAADPNVQAFMSSIGPSGSTSAGNIGRMNIRLKPRSERKLSADEVIQVLRKKTAGVTGIKLFMQNSPPVRIGGRLTKRSYQYTLQGSDTEELYKIATAFEGKMKQLTELQDVTSDLQIKNPQVNLAIDRDKAAAMGVSAQQIERALSMTYGTLQVSTILAPNNQYQVILELLP